MTVPQFVQQWTEQAAHDLEAARTLLQAGYYDTCIVQCQQSVEKDVKALWTHLAAVEDTPGAREKMHDNGESVQGAGAVAPGQYPQPQH
jgi:HEPN domain-containing protein